MKQIIKLLFIIILLASCNYAHKTEDAGIFADFVTTEGTIRIKLFEKEKPLTVANFVANVEGSVSFEDVSRERLLGHKEEHHHDHVENQEEKIKRCYLSEQFRVGEKLVELGTNYAPRRGRGGYRLPFEKNSKLSFNRSGMVGMLSSKAGYSNNTVFFITKEPSLELDSGCSLFGEVIDGKDLLYSIQSGDLLDSIYIVRGSGYYSYSPTVESIVSLLNEFDKSGIQYVFDKVFAKYPEAMQTESSLVYFPVIKEGLSNTLPKNGKEQMFFHYIFSPLLFTDKPAPILTNTYLDVPSIMLLDEVRMEGLKEALSMMNIGEKRRFIIPYTLGFGASPVFSLPAKLFLDVTVERFGSQKEADSVLSN